MGKSPRTRASSSGRGRSVKCRKGGASVEYYGGRGRSVRRSTVISCREARKGEKGEREREREKERLSDKMITGDEISKLTRSPGRSRDLDNCRPLPTSPPRVIRPPLPSKNNKRQLALLFFANCRASSSSSGETKNSAKSNRQVSPGIFIWGIDSGEWEGSKKKNDFLS